MYQSIVVGTDGSENAMDAIRNAGVIARDTAADVIHVVAAREKIPFDLGEHADELPEHVRDAVDPQMVAQTRLADAALILGEFGIKVVEHDREDDPADAILDVADAESADLIVVGTRGLGTSRRFRLGSVSTKVSQSAICAVLIIPSTS